MTYTLNTELNGIEIAFDEKPGEAVREALKQSGFRWHKARRIWYAKNTPARLELVQGLEASGEAPEAQGEAKPAAPAPANRYGVVVGDIFAASWGYDQTNVDYFQVVELVGTSSVRVVEVWPEIVEASPVSGMSEDRTYKIDRTPQPRAGRSVFIKDQEHGDLKRLKSYRQDGTHPQFKLSSFADAYYCDPGEDRQYVSWYA